MKDLQQFRFDLAFVRRAPNDTLSRDTLTELDLSSSGLESLDLSGFPLMQKLSLANNGITDGPLSVSGISKLTSLYFLDLSSNKLKSLDRLVVVLNSLTLLRYLDLSWNPCCEKMNRIEVGKRFERLADARSCLQYLNKAELSVEERCQIANLLGVEDLHRFRLSFCLFQRKADEKCSSLHLAGCNLTSLNGLEGFANLVGLDLSNNQLIEMKKEVFSGMKLLAYLDLSNNCFDCTLEHLTSSLSQCKNLEILHILKSLKNGSTDKR